MPCPPPGDLPHPVLERLHSWELSYLLPSRGKRVWVLDPAVLPSERHLGAGVGGSQTCSPASWLGEHVPCLSLPCCTIWLASGGQYPPAGPCPPVTQGEFRPQQASHDASDLSPPGSLGVGWTQGPLEEGDPPGLGSSLTSPSLRPLGLTRTSQFEQPDQPRVHTCACVLCKCVTVFTVPSRWLISSRPGLP